jgi:hypothetical protein
MDWRTKQRRMKLGTLTLSILLPVIALSTFVSAADSNQSVPKTVGPPHAIGPMFWGINIENVYLNPVLSWTDPSLEAAIQNAGIESVRFPGGDAGNYWDWQQGTMYPLGGSSNAQDFLADLSSLNQATGVQPLYNLNLMTYNNKLITKATLSAAMDNQIQLLQAAQALGLPVSDIELGNEFYWSEHDHNREFPTAKDYQLTANLWAATLKQSFPNAKFASMLSIPSSGDQRTRTWNTPVLENIQGIDAVTIHRYDSIIDGGVWDGTPADAVLSLAFTDWATIMSGEVRPAEQKRLRIWITEFGGFSDCTNNAQFSGTWLEGLYQTQMALQFLSTPSIDQMQLYNITGATNSLIFQNTSSYWDSCLGKTITFNATPGDLTATGQAYALIGAALRLTGTQSASEVVFPEAPYIKPGAGVKPYRSVTGVALTGATNQWLIANYGPDTMTLHYAGMGKGTIQTLSAPSLTTIVNGEGILTNSTAPFDGESFVLPPFSLNWIVTQ